MTDADLGVRPLVLKYETEAERVAYEFGSSPVCLFRIREPDIAYLLEHIYDVDQHEKNRQSLTPRTQASTAHFVGMIPRLQARLPLDPVQYQKRLASRAVTTAKPSLLNRSVYTSPSLKLLNIKRKSTGKRNLLRSDIISEPAPLLKHAGQISHSRLS